MEHAVQPLISPRYTPQVSDSAKYVYYTSVRVCTWEGQSKIRELQLRRVYADKRNCIKSPQLLPNSAMNSLSIIVSRISFITYDNTVRRDIKVHVFNVPLQFLPLRLMLVN